MTPEIAACIRIRMGGLIMLFSSRVTAPQHRKNPPDWRWRFCRRRGLFGLKLSELVRLQMPERMPDACGGSETSRQGSELLQRGSYSCPWNPETANNCFGWALMDLMITGYRSMKLMMRMMPEFRKETEPVWLTQNKTRIDVSLSKSC